MFSKINSFHEVKFSNEENILLLCDIDGTVLLNGRTHTDKEGFDQMILRLMNGTFLFLTARHWDEEEITKHQLKWIGIPESLLQNIHFTGPEITKGEYMRDYLFNEIKQHSRVIFIDDFPSYLESTSILQKENIDLTCYQFALDATSSWDDAVLPP